MKTQINTLLSGTKSQLLNSSIDYSTFPKATSHLGHAGTKHETCDKVWNDLIKENPENLIVEILGQEIELQANWSLSGKSVDYIGTVDADFAINKLGLTENNTKNGVSITVSFSNIIVVSYGKKAHFYICPSLITILETNKKTNTMNYSAEAITDYINENINLVRNSNWNIYESPNGLVHTTQSMEYRDEDFNIIMTFSTGDEIPEGDDLLNSVEFQMK